MCYFVMHVSFSDSVHCYRLLMHNRCHLESFSKFHLCIHYSLADTVNLCIINKCLIPGPPSFMRVSVFSLSVFTLFITLVFIAFQKQNTVSRNNDILRLAVMLYQYTGIFCF